MKNDICAKRFMAVSAVALGLALPRLAAAGDLYLVAHPGVTLTQDEVREAFLGDKQFAGSVKLQPVENASLQTDFQSRVLKVDAARYASIWSKKGFREGMTPPPVRATDAEVINGVKANAGSVGYVSKPTADVKVLAKL